MIKKLLEHQLKYGIYLFVELILLSLFPLSIVLRFVFKVDYKTVKTNKKMPIVIVSQWFTQNALHLIMRRFLENRGHPVYLFNYSIYKGGIDDGAQELKKFLNDRKIGRCTLVGISSGAVTSYAYAQKYGGWKHIVKIISVGGPFFGTPWAIFYIFSKTGRDLVPWSNFMKNLHKIKNKYPKRIVSVVSVFDEFVPPRSGVLPDSKVKKIDIVGHNNLHIWSNDVFKIISNEAKP